MELLKAFERKLVVPTDIQKHECELLNVPFVGVYFPIISPQSYRFLFLKYKSWKLWNIIYMVSTYSSAFVHNQNTRNVFNHLFFLFSAQQLNNLFTLILSASSNICVGILLFFYILLGVTRVFWLLYNIVKTDTIICLVVGFICSGFSVSKFNLNLQ